MSLEVQVWIIVGQKSSLKQMEVVIQYKEPSH